MARWLVVFLLLLAPLSASAQSVLYATSGEGSLSSLYRVDPQNASATLIGQIYFDVDGSTYGAPVTALAFHPITGLLYGVTGNEYDVDRVLFTINISTAQTTSIGTIGTTDREGVSDIAFASDGTLYGWTVRGGPLVSISLSDASRTVIGSAVNGTRGNGLAITPAGTVYVVGPVSTGDLYTVNTTTGALTSIATIANVPLNFGSTSLSTQLINAMASNGNGVLYATGRSDNRLVTIGLDGEMTVIGTLPFDTDAMAFAPVPEPSTFALMLLGLIGCLILRQWRQAEYD